MRSLTEKYVTETETVETPKPYWNTLKVHICRVEGDQKVKIGEYDRNYHRLFDTFHPFEQGGKEYALYSRSYTSTRVMSLPDCKDLGGEDPHGFGFCPTEYYVPVAIMDGEEYDPDGQFGFVAGCVWGDDSSWKIQFLDLSRVSEGIIKRDDRFGYIELLESHSLKDAIDISWWDKESQCVHIACAKMFALKEEQED